MRCGRCGNDNADSNRFCGMCGASLAQPDESAGKPSTGSVPTASRQPAPIMSNPVRPNLAQAGPSQPVSRLVTQATAARPNPVDSSAAERRSSPVSSTVNEPKAAPLITGPSFLGLSTPGPASDGSASRDTLRRSGNVDYLLEDDEPKRGHGMMILIVLALLLAAGFGYLHYKQGGFDWLKAVNKRAAPASDVSQNNGNQSNGNQNVADQSNGSQNSGNNPSGKPASSSTTAPDASASQQTASQQTASQQTASQPGAAGGTTPSAGGASTTPPDSQASQPNSSLPPAAQSPAQQSSQQPQNQTDSTDPANSISQPTSSDSEAATPHDTIAPRDRAHKPASSKPAPEKPTAGRPFDVAAQAERYIYGRGVRQDCEHGLHLLKPAAEQSNLKAMISLGALYSTGTCTPRDLPTAYRWFALALHKQPDNQALQDDLKSLWEKMTPPERQLAIKMSQ